MLTDQTKTLRKPNTWGGGGGGGRERRPGKLLAVYISFFVGGGKDVRYIFAAISPRCSGGGGGTPSGILTAVRFGFSGSQRLLLLINN